MLSKINIDKLSIMMSTSFLIIVVTWDLRPISNSKRRLNSNSSNQMKMKGGIETFKGYQTIILLPNTFRHRRREKMMEKMVEKRLMEKRLMKSPKESLKEKVTATKKVRCPILRIVH